MQQSRNRFFVHIMGRTVRSDSEEANSVTLQTIFNQNLRLNRASSNVVFHPDKIQFKDKGYREFLPYSDISHFYESAEHPNVFMLHVIENENKRSCYESYRCDSASDVRAIRNLLYNVSKNPVHLFREISFGARLSSGSSSSGLERSVSRTLYESRPQIKESVKLTGMTSSRDNLHHPAYIIPVRRTQTKQSPKIIRQVQTHPEIQNHVSRPRYRGHSPSAYRAVSTTHVQRKRSSSRSPSRYRTSIYTEQYVPITYQRTRSVYVPVTVQHSPVLKRYDPVRRSGRKEPLVIYAPR